MGKENDKDASAKDRRKRMRESGSRTEEEEHHVGLGEAVMRRPVSTK